MNASEIGIIIQGRIDEELFEKIDKAYCELENNIFLVHYNKNLNIKNKISKIKLLQLDPFVSTYEGYADYQSKAILKAIEFMNSSHFLKIRSDMIPNTPEDLFKLLQILTVKNKLTSFSLSVNMQSMIQDWLIFGTRNQQIDYWDIEPTKKMIFPCPEHRFFANYVIKNKLNLCFQDLSNPNLILKHFDFLIKEIHENKIDIKMWNNRKYECDIKHYGTADKSHFINY